MIHGIHGQNDVEKGRDEMDVLLQGAIVQKIVLFKCHLWIRWDG